MISLSRWLSGKESASSAGDVGLIPGSRRSLGAGNGNLLQYSCLGNSMNRGAWWATVHGVAKSQTQLRAHTHSDKKRARGAGWAVGELDEQWRSCEELLSSLITCGALKLELYQRWYCLRQAGSLLNPHVNNQALAAGCSEEEECIIFWKGSSCSAMSKSLQKEAAVAFSSQHSVPGGWAPQPAGSYQWRRL